MLFSKGKKPPAPPRDEIQKEEPQVPVPSQEQPQSNQEFKETVSSNAVEAPPKEEKSETALPELPPSAMENPVKSSDQKGKIHHVWIWQESKDCLWRLAKKYYGDPWQWKKIYLANRNNILDPNIIFPKQKIVIPSPD